MRSLTYEDHTYVYYITFDKTKISGNRCLIYCYSKTPTNVYYPNGLRYGGVIAFSYSDKIHWDRPWFKSKVFMTDELKKFCDFSLRFAEFW